jgi:hypothetical protein
MDVIIIIITTITEVVVNEKVINDAVTSHQWMMVH